MSENAPACDVAIVGLGPVGAALANVLGQFGIDTMVFEKEAAAYHLPRAVAFDSEIMRIFQSLGLAERIEPITGQGEGMRFVAPDGELLLDWSRPPGITPMGWRSGYLFHQPDLEAILRDGMARFPSVNTRPECEVTRLEPDDGGVTIKYRHRPTGDEHTARACYVVGCDGARSFTRNVIGSEFDDLGFHEPWLVVDLVLKKPRPDLGNHAVQFCEPDRSATYVPTVGNRRRWEFRLNDGDDPEKIIKPDVVWGLLERWLTPEEARLDRSAVYTFHSAVAETWRRGRIMIAGDAAHQTPPFMGQGMCAGIRDAANVGWKLDRILKGHAGGELLDTYQSERDPHVREFIELTVKLGHIINTTATALVSGSATPPGDGPQKLNQLIPRLGPGLEAGLTDLTGSLVPQPRLSTGERLDDTVGWSPALLMRTKFASEIGENLGTDLAAKGIEPVDDPAVEGWLTEIGFQAVLMRPDRYILGAANSLDEARELVAAA